jgi:hypothetical protein
MRTNLERVALRAAARMYGVSVEEIQAAILNPHEAEVIGFSGFDWMGLLTQMLQLLLESLQNCQARPAVFQSIRKPGIFAKAVTRNRADRIFSRGNAKFANMGGHAVEALLAEAEGLQDSELAAVMGEVQNPNPYMVI